MKTLLLLALSETANVQNCVYYRAQWPSC